MKHRCQVCPEPATVHVTELVDGHARVVHYCENHGKPPRVQETVVPSINLGNVVATVRVSRSQVERQETIPVELPSGDLFRLRLPSDLRVGQTCYFRIPFAGPSGKPYCVRVHVAGDQNEKENK